MVTDNNYFFGTERLGGPVLLRCDQARRVMGRLRAHLMAISNTQRRDQLHLPVVRPGRAGQSFKVSLSFV